MQTNYFIETKKKAPSQIFFQILLALVWTQHTIWPYLIQVIRRVPIIGLVYNYILPVLIITAALMSLPYIFKKAKASDLLFFIGCILLVVFSYVVFPANQMYIEEKLGKIFLYTLPMYFMGISCTGEDCKKTLYWSSLCSVTTLFFYQLILFGRGDLIGAYNMDVAYKALPSVMFLVSWVLEKHGLHNWLIAAGGILLVLTYGTRGPMLAVLIFLCIGIYVRVLRSQKRYVRLIFIISAAIIIILFSSPSISVYIFERLSKWFESIGFSTRIFDFILEGELAESTGRDILLSSTIAAVGQRPFLGYGIMGDRVILGGIYCHNIFWEFMCDFGVLLGSIFLLSIVVLIFRAIKGTKNNENSFFVLSFVIMVITKLFLSYSYIIEPYFFFMLGVCVVTVRNSKHIKEGAEL